MNKPAVLIVVENLPVPLDRRVWQESCALREAGYEVAVICPERFEAKFGRRGPIYWGVRLAERITYRCADVVLATNESVRAVAARRGKKAPEQIFVVRTAPKIPDLNLPADPELRRGRKYLVGYIGVMGDADGVEYILEGAAHLVHRLGRRDVQFLLMGTGPEHERLVQQRDECARR